MDLNHLGLNVGFPVGEKSLHGWMAYGEGGSVGLESAFGCAKVLLE